MKRINVSLSEVSHDRLVALKSVLRKRNFDATIEELINRVFKEVGGGE